MTALTHDRSNALRFHLVTPLPQAALDEMSRVMATQNTPVTPDTKDVWCSIFGGIAHKHFLLTPPGQWLRERDVDYQFLTGMIFSRAASIEFASREDALLFKLTWC